MSIERRTTRKGAVYDVRLRAPDGRQYSRTFDTKREAQAFEAAQRIDKARGRWLDPRKASTPFETVAANWLRDSVGKRPSSRSRDETIIARHLVPAFRGRAVISINPSEVQALVNDWCTRQAPATVGRQYATLRAILAYAVNSDLISRSPCRAVKIPKISSREALIVSGEDLEALAGAMVTHGPMVYLGAVLGLRWGEVAGLRQSRLDFRRSTVTVAGQLTRGEKGRMIEQAPKSGAGRRTMAAPTWLMDMLGAHLTSLGPSAAADRLVFVSPDGGQLHYSNWRRRVWLPAVTAAGLEGLHFHDLRHAAGTALVAEGVDVRTAQARLGHASPQVMLRVYAQGTERADRLAAEKVGNVFCQVPVPGRHFGSGTCTTLLTL
jgi:integrase